MDLKRPRLFRQFIREKLVEHAVAEGADRATAEEAVDMLESERPFIDWFINGGWEQLLKALMTILALFAKPKPV